MVSWALLIFGVAAGLVLLSRRRSASLGFTALALGMTAPLALEPDRLMLAAGAGPDAFIGVWNLWWTGTALAEGLNPFFCDRIFAPAGTSLALHTHAVGYGVLTWPLPRLLGDGPSALPITYNVIVIASFALTGWLTYRLARDLTGHHEASVLAGVIFAFTSFRFANTVRLHVLATEWLVLFVWAAVVLVRRPSPLRLPGLVWAGWLLLHGSLEYSVHGALLGVGILAVAAVRLGRAGVGWRLEGSGRRWGAAVFVAALGIVAAFPFTSQLRARLAEGGVAFDPGLAAHFSADVIDFVVPNPRHPLWGGLTEPWAAALHAGDSGYGLSLGLVSLGLFGLAAVAVVRQRRGLGWLAAGLLGLALSLGPNLRVAGTELAIPTPHDALTALLPILQGSRTPIRWIAPAGLCLSIVVAIAWSRRWPGRTEGGLGRAASGAIALVLFESLAAPLPTTGVGIPGVYGVIAEEARRTPRSRTAVLHVPELPPREKLLYQTTHGQPLVGNLIGAVPHRSPSADVTLRDPAWPLLLREFGQPGALAAQSPESRSRALAAARELLERSGVRWIVVSRSAWIHERRGTSRHPVVRPAEAAAFVESLRALGPVGERSLGEEVLFEFGTD